MTNGKAEKRRIAFFLPTLDGGGTQRAHLLLANAAADCGRDVDLVLGQVRGEFLDMVSPQVRVVDLQGWTPYACLSRLVDYMKEENPIAMFPALNGASVLAILARWLASRDIQIIPAVQNHIWAKGQQKSWPFRLASHAILSFAFRRANRVVAVSDSIRQALIERWKLWPEKVAVVHNPIDLRELRAAACERVPTDWLTERRKVPVIIAVGRLSRQKDFDTLLRAFARLRRSRAMRLIILGEGEERNSLQRLARELAIEPWVLFPGFVSNPHAWMARADCFALSSRWEGSPLVLLEALALGLRIVATDCESGPRELKELGAPLSLVPVGDDEALAGELSAALKREPEPAPVSLLEARESSACVRHYLDLIVQD